MGAALAMAVAATGAGGYMVAHSMPTSDRARDAIQRHEPSLRADLRVTGFRYGAAMVLRLFKSESKLELWLSDGPAYRLFRVYDICAWSGELGPKLKEGDGQSPEGFYHVRPGQLNPNSKFHLSFNLGFPNAYDRAHGRTGSFLMVHGDCSSIGCYAMGQGSFIDRDNSAIEQIWTLMSAAFATGQSAVQVQIFPFRLTPENLARHSDSPWIDFWRNLSEGDGIFQATGLPPVVTIDWQKRYSFRPRGRDRRNKRSIHDSPDP